jgi:vanillate O-demethylase ferredoxin subunit
MDTSSYLSRRLSQGEQALGLMVDPRTVRTTLQARVVAVHREAEDILTFELAPVDGDLPPFEAGAHVDVHLPGGILRQYSLCNDPAERHRYVIAVLRETAGRGGSAALHEVKPGEVVTISAPRNHFPLAGREARSHLLLAGGIGVTPMMAMLATLRERGADYHLHYCTRSPERTAFLDRLAPLIEAGRVTLHHDGGDPARGLDLRALLATYEPGTHLYYCGPTGFMSAVKGATGAWPAHAVHFEYFAAPEAEEGRENAPFQIKIKATGQVLDVPAAQSIVDVLRANGFAIDTDCREGYCGTCITRYFEGEPEHRDTVLSEKERKSYVMICCARAKASPLVLDL